jgi:hypothetical protein
MPCCACARANLTGWINLGENSEESQVRAIAEPGERRVIKGSPLLRGLDQAGGRGGSFHFTSTFLFSIDPDTVGKQLSVPVALYLHMLAFPDIFEEKTFQQNLEKHTYEEHKVRVTSQSHILALMSITHPSSKV